MAAARRLATAGAVSAGGAVALGAWVKVAGELPGERQVLVWAHDVGAPVDRAMLATSRLTDLVPLGVVAVCVLAALLALHRRADAAFFVAGIAVVWAANPVLKEIVARSRPDIWPLPESVSEYGFPSGHAANTAALVGALVMVLPSGRLVGTGGVATLLVVVGLSQLVLGRHYPSDLLAGWLWATAWIIFLGLVRGHLVSPPGIAT